MTKTIVDEEVLATLHPIRPEHINSGKHFFNAFDNNETEISARWIVRLCITLGKWVPFTEQDIENFYQISKFVNFRFNRLLLDGFVVRGDDEKYRVTHEFICACFKSSPRMDLFEKK